MRKKGEREGGRRLMRPERGEEGRREVYCGEEEEEKSMSAAEGSKGEQTRG